MLARTIVEHHHLHRGHYANAGPMKAAYDKAIGASARAGFLQDAALAAHLASNIVPDEHDSLSYFHRAQEFYLRWGARGVVDHLLEKRRGDLASISSFDTTSVQESSASSGTGHRSRRRFDPRFAIERKSLHIPEEDMSFNNGAFLFSSQSST